MMRNFRLLRLNCVSEMLLPNEAVSRKGVNDEVLSSSSVCISVSLLGPLIKTHVFKVKLSNGAVEGANPMG